MKKIIATVLAMVMALALCTTAFAAAQTYDVYGDSDTAIATDVEVTYTKADADAQTIAFYTIDDTAFTGDCFVKVTKAADADLVLKHAGKSVVALYLAEIETAAYDGEGAAYTNLGTDCGKVNWKDAAFAATKSTKFYTAIDEADDETYLFKAVDTGTTDHLLVDGTIIGVEDLGLLSDALVPHTWVVDSEKLTAKCSACGTTAKAYESYVEVPSGATAEQVAGLWIVADKAGTTTDTTASSPKTFDAGIAMYVGMALTSVAGSAVVIGKKKEF